MPHLKKIGTTPEKTSVVGFPHHQ